MNDDYDAQEVALEKANVGKQKIVPRLIQREVLWSTNKNIQLWLLFSYLGAAGGAWLVIGYVISQIRYSRQKIGCFVQFFLKWTKNRLFFHHMFSIRSFSSLFLIGVLNGLLPCGLVYMAIAGAIGTGAVALGSMYMVLFGLGTNPMMLSISLAGNIMSLAIRNKINKLIPVLVVIVGIFFILRGLSLGIPFLSPPKEKIEKKFEKSLENEQSMLQQKSKGVSYFFHA